MAALPPPPSASPAPLGLPQALLSLGAGLCLAAVVLAVSPVDRAPRGALWAAPGGRVLSRSSAGHLTAPGEIRHRSAMGKAAQDLPLEAASTISDPGLVHLPTTLSALPSGATPLLTGGLLVALALALSFFRPPPPPTLALAGGCPPAQNGEAKVDLEPLLNQPMAMAGNRGGQKTQATHICMDCGYIYALPTAFEQQPRNYQCPKCSAGKDRFATYDPVTGETGSTGLPGYLIWTVVGSLGFIGGLLYVAAQR